METAKEIQQKFSDVKIIIPKISDQEAEQGMSDFNDIYLKKGLDEVKKQLNFIDFQNKFKTFQNPTNTHSQKEIIR